MQIVFDDIVYSLQRVGGISELWMQVTKGAPKGSTHIVYDNALTNILFKEIEGHKYIRYTSRGLQIKRFINPSITSQEPFIFHSSYFRTCVSPNAFNVVSIYDFIYEYYRKDVKSLGQKIQKKRAIMKSDAVICISESTKRDLLKICPSYNGLLKVVHCGYDNSLFRFINCSDRNKKCVFIGNRSSYKRFDLAVELVKRLPKEYQLIIVGGGELTQEETAMLNKVLEGRYQKLGFLESHEVSNIYNECRYLIYSSDYEGFGIPPIEAQACGCIPICQNVSSMTEVVENSGVILYKDHIDKTISELIQLESLERWRKKQQEGLDNAKRFSWDRCRKETYEYYKELEECKQRNVKK